MADTTRPHIKTVYRKDGSVHRVVVGVKGGACTRVAEPYSHHLPRTIAMTPTSEMYETPAAPPERQREMEAQ